VALTSQTSHQQRRLQSQHQLLLLWLLGLLLLLTHSLIGLTALCLQLVQQVLAVLQRLC
jgi:hypothetical protein